MIGAAIGVIFAVLEPLVIVYLRSRGYTIGGLPPASAGTMGCFAAGGPRGAEPGRLGDPEADGFGGGGVRPAVFGARKVVW